ncbi:hypothetical protein POM88_001061 [Heracleum sosnowskyi]|uniref:Uncharacterized protein n=1 Tax=Heracleum sosnowskyi TaxID=360622 RepID=A0AAD8JF40_9APIA|nr:hypothetical protein POM88_001061 [Heracleum sosnowskyi]
MFSKVRVFKEEDLIVPIIVCIECFGISMQAWVEENLKAFTSHLGEWLSWEFESNEDLRIFNPRVLIQTIINDKIEEEFNIMVKDSSLLSDDISERCDNTTHSEDNNDREGMVIVSSQNTIYKNLKSLKMGIRRGRPRKHPKPFVNPIDLRLGRKRFNGKIKYLGLFVFKFRGLEQINEVNHDEAHVEVTAIIDTALAVGLEVSNDRLDSIKKLETELGNEAI